MVSKKSFDRTQAGVRPERARLYNVAYPAAGVSREGGATWRFADIQRGLAKRCKDVRDLGRSDNDNQRALGATDRVSDLRFIALMTHANRRPDDIESMLYACVFTGIDMTDAWAERIDRHLGVTLAYNEEGDLYLVASPNIVGAFDPDSFDYQLVLFLDDIRNALRLVLDDGSQRSATAVALKAFMAGSDPALGAFRNSLGANRFQLPREKTMFGPRVDCESCRGSGRRLFSPCKECGGLGFTR